jgi:hypothetical protein
MRERKDGGGCGAVIGGDHAVDGGGRLLIDLGPFGFQPGMI